MFDKMLGLQKDPRLIRIREANPLHQIKVPECDASNLDERMEHFLTKNVGSPERESVSRA